MFKIAILGTENSHARAFANIIYKGDALTNNIPYGGYEIVGLYGDNPEENEKIKEITGGKAEISDNPEAWVGKVDAIMVTARHGGKHFKYAKKYIENGIPAFIDKPITIDPDEAIELIEIARKNNVPLCGGSSCGMVIDTQRMKQLRESDELERIYGGSVSAPVSMKNEWGGFYFYTQHLVQIMGEVFGYDIDSIVAVGREDAATFIARYPNYDVTGHFGSWGYSATIYGLEKVVHTNISLLDGYLTEFRRFDMMLRTGKMFESYEDFIKPVFILNAINEALETGKEVKVRKI